MNINNIKIDMEIKNYKTLFKTLEIKDAEGGNNLELQKLELNRYFNWIKNEKDIKLLLLKFTLSQERKLRIEGNQKVVETIMMCICNI